MTVDADVVVLGGGAAGLLAAWRSASVGASTLLLERNPQTGVKILASGGGRCNVTTTRTGAALARSFPSDQQAFLRPALAALPPQRLRAFFEERGVPLVEEALEKVFPASGRARVIRDSLLAAALQAGVTVRTDWRAKKIETTEDGFRVTAESGAVVIGTTIVLATGGKSYPKAGTTGDGYDLARSLGHTVTALSPSLVGLLVPDREITALAGLTLEDAGIGAFEGERLLASARHPLLFTHQGLSGPAPMDLSREVAVLGAVDVAIDFFPAGDAAALDALIRSNGVGRTIGAALPIPRSLVPLVTRRAKVPESQPLQSVTREARSRVVATLKHLRVRATGTRGFEHAEVTRGGICRSEVDPRSGMSMLVPGLFLVGEVLDVDGPLGGFNFQAAFGTGYLGGEAAARYARSRG